MKSSGARLKELRLEKGYSLEEVHKKTKIHMHIIQAIEEDSIANINPVYLKGFIKIYCGFLGVNPSDYFRDVSAEQARALTADKVEHSVPSPAPQEVVKHLEGTGVKISSKADFRFSGRQAALIAAVAVLALVILNAGRIAPMFKKKHATRRVTVSKPLSVAVKSARAAEPKENKTEKKQPKQDKQKLEASSQDIPQSVDSEIRMVLRAKEDCWVNLKTDGQVVFRSMLKKGRFENFIFKDKGELSLGNAGAIELEVNGKFIPSLGRRGQSIKNIVISRKGLVIPK